jgi:hypothetical protein
VELYLGERGVVALAPMALEVRVPLTPVAVAVVDRLEAQVLTVL